MKRFSLLLSFLILAVFTLTSCNNGPDGVARKWLTAYYHKDFATAKALSTPEMQESLMQMEEMNKIPGSDTVRAALDSARNLSVDIRGTRLINDSTAEVTYVVSNNTANPQTITLAKMDNKWLVAWSKITLQGDLDNPMSGGSMPLTPDPGTVNAVDAFDTVDMPVAPQADPIDTSGGNMMR